RAPVAADPHHPGAEHRPGTGRQGDLPGHDPGRRGDPVDGCVRRYGREPDGGIQRPALVAQMKESDMNMELQVAIDEAFTQAQHELRVRRSAAALVWLERAHILTQ